MLTLIALAVAGGALIAHRPIGAALSARGQGSAASTYFVRTLVMLAILEGAALFSLVALLVEGQAFLLAVVGLLLGAMALLFPTRGRFEGFVKWHEPQATGNP